MLYTLMQSPWQCDINTLKILLQKDDDLILLQDGVLAALKETYRFFHFNILPISIWVLKSDVEARGLIQQISNKVLFINYNDFVNLTIKHTQQIIW